MPDLRRLGFAFSRFATVLVIASAVIGCFPSDSTLITVWVSNRESDAVLLRHTDENGVVVLEIPGGYSGRAAHFSSGTHGRIELLSRSCTILDGPVAMPSSGSVVLEVEGDSLVVSPTTDPSTIDEPLLTASDACPTQ